MIQKSLPPLAWRLPRGARMNTRLRGDHPGRKLPRRRDNDDAADPRWTIDAHGKSVKMGETIEEVSEDASALEGKGRAKRAAPSKRRSQEPSKRARPEKKDPIPHVTSPELATLIDAPFDDDAWFFEIKWDGFRAIATVDADHGAHLASRNGKDLLARFPTLASIGAAFDGIPVVVDGEIVALDNEGKSSFQRLQNGPGTNLSYVVFDVLYAEGRDLRGEPLEARKEILGRIVKTKAKSVVVSRTSWGRASSSSRLRARRGWRGSSRSDATPSTSRSGRASGSRSKRSSSKSASSWVTPSRRAHGRASARSSLVSTKGGSSFSAGMSGPGSMRRYLPP